MRLFFSVPLPQEAKDRAARALAPARAAAGELSWTKPEQMHLTLAFLGEQPPEALERDRKSTRLNSSHRCISYAVFCLKKKKKTKKNKLVSASTPHFMTYYHKLIP